MYVPASFVSGVLNCSVVVPSTIALLIDSKSDISTNPFSRSPFAFIASIVSVIVSPGL